MNNLLLAFSLTLFAGLATGIGSALAVFARRTNFGFLAVSLGFSAGVMLYISFTEILGKAEETLVVGFGERAGAWITAAAFFGGILVIGLIDLLVPRAENPHEARAAGDLAGLKPDSPPYIPSDRLPSGETRLMRMGVFTAMAIAIHNFPEGMATFVATLEDANLGIAIAVAIALHNIPEGISVSVPIYYATGSRRRAFQLSFLSGVAEPVGAVAGYLALQAVFTPTILGILFAGVAGVMVYISLDELIPTAREYGKGHESLVGIFSGMAVMAVSLLLMK